MKKKVLMPIAEGTEEMEAVIIADILRRAGAEVNISGLTNLVKCSRGIIIVPDTLFSELKGDEIFDLIVFPGGMKGVENLINSSVIREITLKNKLNAIISAICAAPLILKEFGLIKPGDAVTGHPSIIQEMINFDFTENPIEISGNIITSRGAGTALDFSLKLVEILFGKTVSSKIANDIVYYSYTESWII